MPEVTSGLQLARELSGLTSSTALIFVILAGYKGWWVFGRQLIQERADFERQITALRSDMERQLKELRESHLEMRRERDEYKTLLLRTLRVAETTTAALATKTSTTEG